MEPFDDGTFLGAAISAKGSVVSRLRTPLIARAREDRYSFFLSFPIRAEPETVRRLMRPSLHDPLLFARSVCKMAKIKAYELAEELKEIMRPLYEKHMDDIMTGAFSSGMMEDWADGDSKLLGWRSETSDTEFETTENTSDDIGDQEYFDHGILMVAMVKAGVELAYEVMTATGIKEESAYYESLHETPLIANTIARKKLFEMKRII